MHGGDELCANRGFRKLGLFDRGRKEVSGGAPSVDTGDVTDMCASMSHALQEIIDFVTTGNPGDAGQIAVEVSRLDGTSGQRLVAALSNLWVPEGANPWTSDGESMNVYPQFVTAQKMAVAVAAGNPVVDEVYKAGLGVGSRISTVDPHIVATAASNAAAAVVAQNFLPPYAAALLFSPWGWAIRLGRVPKIRSGGGWGPSLEPFFVGSPIEFHPSIFPSQPDLMGIASLAANGIYISSTGLRAPQFWTWDSVTKFGSAVGKPVFGFETDTDAFVIVNASDQLEVDRWHASFQPIEARRSRLLPVMDSTASDRLRLRWSLA